MTPGERVQADAALAARTREVYERRAALFDAERARDLHERAWLDRFLEGVEPGRRVLDLGCGTGDPMAAHMSARGLRVVGLDASRPMLEIARRRYPEGDWREGDMRALDLPERFDAVLAWDSFFHLTPAEQRRVLPRIAAHMTEGAPLMLTVGPRAGEVVGHVGGEPVYHASLDLEEYRRILGGLSLEVDAFVPEDPSCGHHTVLLARRRSRPPQAGGTPPA